MHACVCLYVHDISSLVNKSFIQLYIIACSAHYGIIDILERVKDVFLRFALPNVEVNKQAHASCTILPVVLSQLLLITTTRCSAHSKEGLNRILCKEQGKIKKQF